MAIPVPVAGQDGLASWGAAVASAINGGVAFPGSPATGDRFWRTDLGMEFYYNGTRWLSSQLFIQHTDPFTDSPLTATDTFSASSPAPTAVGSDIWLEKTVTQFLVGVGTALGASHKWVGSFTKSPTGDTDTAVITVNIASGASSAWRTDSQTIGALMNSGTLHFAFKWGWVKTGTPGNLYARSLIYYRHVAT